MASVPPSSFEDPEQPVSTRADATATAVAVVSALALTGCSGSSNEDGGADATVRVGLVLEPTSLDIRTQSGAALDQVLIDNVYQGLVGRTADGDVRDVLASKHAVSDEPEQPVSARAETTATAVTARAARPMREVRAVRRGRSGLMGWWVPSGAVATVVARACTRLAAAGVLRRRFFDRVQQTVTSRPCPDRGRQFEGRLVLHRVPRLDGDDLRVRQPLGELRVQLR